MRKRKKGRKLSRKRNQRKALIRELAKSLILRGKIKTTRAKAKEVSAFVEKKISRAKKGNPSTRRFLSRLFPPKVVKKLVEEIAPKYKERAGGYTKILKLGPRKSNGAEMVIIEFV